MPHQVADSVRGVGQPSSSRPVQQPSRPTIQGHPPVRVQHRPLHTDTCQRGQPPDPAIATQPNPGPAHRHRQRCGQHQLGRRSKALPSQSNAGPRGDAELHAVTQAAPEPYLDLVIGQRPGVGLQIPQSFHDPLNQPPRPHRTGDKLPIQLDGGWCGAQHRPLGPVARHRHLVDRRLWTPVKPHLTADRPRGQCEAGQVKRLHQSTAKVHLAVGESGGPGCKGKQAQDGRGRGQNASREGCLNLPDPDPVR